MRSDGRHVVTDLTAVMLSPHIAQNYPFICVEILRTERNVWIRIFFIQPRFEPCTSVPQILRVITTNIVHICS